ncbi:FAD:protein FMN transferase [bacterium]|jgi:FAD:protein FMN transferase|nr:FAD:protein FMN transferase [bacterium]
MTTNIQIIASHHEHLARDAYTYMESLAQAINFYDPISDLSLLNNSSKEKWVGIPKSLYAILELSLKLQNETNNLFRIDFEGLSKTPDGHHGITIKGNQTRLEKDTIINLSGIGKGYIVDKTFEYLEANGAQNILVNAGGDIRVKSIERPWKIGLTNPFKPSQIFGHINSANSAIVSSGDYARSIKTETGDKTTHFYDPKKKGYIDQTPYSSITVEGPSAAIAEVYAKCLMIDPSCKIKKAYNALAVDRQTKQVTRIR